jgi:glycosyltransferase involved in cell wall biosynthesis
MKIGIVVDNELNSDIRVLREIGILEEEGYEIYILCFGFFKTYPEPGKNLRITRINLPLKLKDILFFLLNTIPLYEWLWSYRIKRFILQNDLESLHVHDLYMARSGKNGIKRSKRKIPMILDLHENYPYTVTTYNWTKGFFRSMISRPEDRIIVLSNDFRDLLLKRYRDLPTETFVTLPNVPNLSQPEYKIKKSVPNPFKPGSVTLFYYGVIAERRGIFDALEVFTRLIIEEYPVNFLLIGPVDKKDLHSFSKLISQKLFAGHIHYIPWIDAKEFPDYLDTCDICIAPFHKNPQHESGVANKIYDYMLGGKPIIASNCKPQQELIEKHNCGLIFKNAEEFHDQLLRLISDSALREELGRNGRKAILAEYNTDIVKENLILLYENLYL